MPLRKNVDAGVRQTSQLLAERSASERQGRILPPPRHGRSPSAASAAAHRPATARTQRLSPARLGGPRRECGRGGWRWRGRSCACGLVGWAIRRGVHWRIIRPGTVRNPTARNRQFAAMLVAAGACLHRCWWVPTLHRGENRCGVLAETWRLTSAGAIGIVLDAVTVMREARPVLVERTSLCDDNSCSDRRLGQLGWLERRMLASASPRRGSADGPRLAASVRLRGLSHQAELVPAPHGHRQDRPHDSLYGLLEPALRPFPHGTRRRPAKRRAGTRHPPPAPPAMCCSAPTALWNCGSWTSRIELRQFRPVPMHQAPALIARVQGKAVPRQGEEGENPMASVCALRS